MALFPLSFHRPLGFVVALACVFLSACNGGVDVDQPAASTNGPAAVTRAAATKDTATATATWTTCAAENQLCSFTGTRLIRYGTQTQYVTGSYTNQVWCSNPVFGDPSPGNGKTCSYAADPAPPAGNWIVCASESQYCAFTGTSTVRYGAGTSFAMGVYTDGVYCSNPVFGDPAIGVGKSCSYLPATTSAASLTPATDPGTVGSSWIFCANESQLCSFTGTGLVRYGAGTSYATGAFTNGVNCSNPVFGDPAPGVGKSCSYLATSSIATASTTAPAITVQPQPVAIAYGQSATFAVTVTSAVSVTYQWARNGVAISGATGSTYLLAMPTLADSGAAFKVTVANSVGTVVSTAAGLTVNAVASSGATAQRLFSDQSLWNARPTKFTVTSDRIATSSYFPFIGNGIYSVVGAIASTTDPAVTVMGKAGQSGLWVPDAETYVPSIVIPNWPASVAPAAGSDGHADIIDVANNRIHSFWQLAKGSDGQWRAAQYTWTPLDGTGWGTSAAYIQGSRAAGVVPIAGLVRVNEVNDGLPMYRHALAMSLTGGTLSGSPAFAFPATAADGDAGAMNTGHIPEGTRIVLPADFDTSGITNPALLKIVQTLKIYGAYVVDRNVGTPYVIYVENGSNFNLMSNGWDNGIAAQLQTIRAALQPVDQVTEWVDANGAVFTPATNLNLLSMRGYWYADAGPVAGTFDTWQQAVVFPANGIYTSQINSAGRSVPAFMTATPAAGTRFRLHVTATGNASLRLTLTSMGGSFDSGVMHDGDDVILTWPAGATGALAKVRVSSGPQGGGKVSGAMVRLSN